MLKLISKTICKGFYAAHAGLFLFAFYLAFGIVEAAQLVSYHKTLMLMVYSSPLILALVYSFWTLYILKCLLFIRKELRQEQYRFVFLLGVAPKKEQFNLWIKVYVALFLPILIYTVPMIYVGIVEGHYIGVLCTIIFIIILLSTVSGYMFRIINYSHVPVKVYFIFPFPQLKKPYWTWPFYYLLSEQTLMLFLSKILSFSLFKVVIWVFSDVSQDIRVLLIGILAAVLSHSMVVEAMLRQERDQLSFNKSLPISQVSRIGQTLLVFMLLLLPEILLYLYHLQGQIQPFLLGLLFGMAGLMTLRMLLYWIKLDLDRYFKWLLSFFFINMFVILSGYAFHYCLLMVSSYFLYFFYYDQRTDLQEVI